MERGEKSSLERAKTPCLREEYLTDEVINQTPTVLVPKLHLYGVQPKDAYSTRSRRRIQKMLDDEENRGYLSLLQNPSVVVPIFTKNAAYLAITDGHHRARYVDRRVVPCRLIPAELAVRIYNKHAEKPITLQEYQDDLFASMANTLRSFDTMDERKHPDPVRVSSFEELVGKFEQIPNLRPMSRNIPINVNRNDTV